VNREVLVAALKSHGINNKFIEYIQFYLKNRECVTDNLNEADGIP